MGPAAAITVNLESVGLGISEWCFMGDASGEKGSPTVGATELSSERRTGT